jgi:hypothetical protein
VPKSIRRAVPSPATIMFSGLMSQCSTPRECTYASAVVACHIHSRRAMGGAITGTLYAVHAIMSTGTSSITSPLLGCPHCAPSTTPYPDTRNGCRRVDVSMVSRWNMARPRAWAARAALGNFTATGTPL